MEIQSWKGQWIEWKFTKGFHSRLEQAEEKISELQDGPV